MVATQIGSAAWNKASKQLIASAGLLGIFEGLTNTDLQSNGPYTGGDDCLAQMAEAENLVLLTLGGSEQSTAQDYQTLLTWWPHSAHAVEAQSWLNGHRFPIPSPAPNAAP